MELPHRHSGTAASRILGAMLAGAGLVALCIGSQAAIAASNSTIGDNASIVADLRSLQVRVESLSLDIPDPVADDDQGDLDTPIDTDPVAPVLRLTPRVATILREVFGPDVLAVPATGTVADDTDQDGDGDTPGKISPLASESAPATAAPDLADARSHFDVPRFHRQMYRTDI